MLCFQYCEKKVEVHFVTGNHLTLLGSKDCAAIINQQLVENDVITFKNSIMSDDSK
jgi:hypothetical protein